MPTAPGAPGVAKLGFPAIRLPLNRKFPHTALAPIPAPLNARSQRPSRVNTEPATPGCTRGVDVCDQLFSAAAVRLVNVVPLGSVGTTRKTWKPWPLNWVALLLG